MEILLLIGFIIYTAVLYESGKKSGIKEKSKEFADKARVNNVLKPLNLKIDKIEEMQNGNLNLILKKIKK